MDLSICVPTFRRPELFRRCLDHLFKALAVSKLDVQVIISDNNNGGAYDSIWKDFAKQIESFNVCVVSAPINLSATDNWKQALSLVASPHYILLSDDDYIISLTGLEGKLDRNCTIFCSSDVASKTTTREKKFPIDKELKPLKTAILIAIGRIKPTLCSTVMTRSSLKAFLGHTLLFGQNGDHADGFLILSSLASSEKSKIMSAKLSTYSLEGQGYSSSLRILDHLFVAKPNFIWNCLRFLPKLYFIFACIWAVLGSFVFARRQLVQRLKHV